MRLSTPEEMLQELLPPSPHRTLPLLRKPLQVLIQYMEQRRPFMYWGRVYELRFTALGMGVHRVWLEEQP